MRRDSKKPYLLSFIAVVFIFLFVYTSVSKLLELNTFRAVISQAPFLGAHAGLVSIGLPLLEMAVALLLFFPRTQTVGLYGSFFMMLIFTTYLGYMVLRAPHLPCSCGGVIRQLTWKQHLVFNVVLTILAGWGCVLARQRDLPSNDTDLPVVQSAG